MPLMTTWKRPLTWIPLVDLPACESGGAGPRLAGLAGRHPDPTGVRLLQDLRRQLFNPSAPKEVVDEAVAAAA
jgi:hypothetical protein